ncbi:pleckstrin homology domain-containing family B member 2 isoform X5 [Pteropus alecto]|uniref:pleckstrin homology domain-containing family B member 2 isoform X5 n=1 Tax=Pteropus alecto TaxID=9402 RepID=UPI00076852CA|nr:pleckstrin homology domain-containing family B member 2 isoform X5 [Pteropus alecto]
MLLLLVHLCSVPWVLEVPNPRLPVIDKRMKHNLQDHPGTRDSVWRVVGGEKMTVVKSGWLLRQSTILKRWKKNWFDLWSDGHLIYYDDHTRQSVEDKVHMPVDCINIRTGHECRDIQPPDGKPKDCMLQIVCRDGKTISLCAESMDDCLAWKFTLQDSRTNTAYVGSKVTYDDTAVASSPPPYTAYVAPNPEAYGYGPYSGAYPPGTQVVYAENGQAYAVSYQYPYAVEKEENSII